MPKFHPFQPVRVVNCCYPELVGMETIVLEYNPVVALDRARNIKEPGWRTPIPHPQAYLCDSYSKGCTWFGESQLEPLTYRPSDEELEEVEKDPEEEMALIELAPKQKQKIKAW